MKTIGIDLGTTNTVAAIDANVISQATERKGSAVVPSVVAFPPSGETVVGKRARNRRAIDPKNTIFSAKRIIGQTWHSSVTAKFRSQYPFDLAEIDGDPVFRTRAGLFSPQQIGAKVIDHILALHGMKADQYQPVIAVPASFDEASEQATVEVAQLAGFNQAVTIKEPVATAIAYATISGELPSCAAVYDLGGGTFDLAIIDCSANPPRVVQHGGDRYLGGDDIDRAIADWAANQVIEQHGWDLRSDAEVFDRLVIQCELAKARLAFIDEYRIKLSQIDPAMPVPDASVVLDRTMLDELSSDLVRRTFLICDHVLGEAGVRARDLDSILLAGGATLLPMVREGVAQYFGKSPRCELNPMEVVSAGASLHES